MHLSHCVLAIQSFGRQEEYKRALLTILSYIAFSDISSKVILFTDQPEWFTDKLVGVEVNYVVLTQEKIKNMRGEIDFLHRMKIALIEETFFKYPGYRVLYADSDTFFTKDPAVILNNLEADKSCMHLLEYPFSAMKDLELPAGQTFQDFYKMILRKSFSLQNRDLIKVTPEMVSWNAGVMFFHPDHIKFIPDVYALTDQFYPETLNHASEQYAFSVILQTRTKIIPCESVSYHYWYRIKKVIADEFLEKHMNPVFISLPLKDKLEEIKEWTVLLPGIFDTHIWMIRDNAIQAFNKNKFFEGYRWSVKAFFQSPLDSKLFIKDVFYHLKRQLTYVRQ